MRYLTDFYVSFCYERFFFCVFVCAFGVCVCVFCSVLHCCYLLFTQSVHKNRHTEGEKAKRTICVCVLLLFDSTGGKYSGDCTFTSSFCSS